MYSEEKRVSARGCFHATAWNTAWGTRAFGIDIEKGNLNSVKNERMTTPWNIIFHLDFWMCRHVLLEAERERWSWRLWFWADDPSTSAVMVPQLSALHIQSATVSGSTQPRPLLSLVSHGFLPPSSDRYWKTSLTQTSPTGWGRLAWIHTLCESFKLRKRLVVRSFNCYRPNFVTAQRASPSPKCLSQCEEGGGLQDRPVGIWKVTDRMEWLLICVRNGLFFFFFCNDHIKLNSCT